MKMKELEERTGVGREAIRFYIREGLLPEPDRPKKNVARYSDDHVIRIKAIKRLQEERFLPLAVIKALLAAEDGAGDVDPAAFPALDMLMHARLDGPEPGQVKLEELSVQTGIDAEKLEELAGIGIITIHRGKEGDFVDGRDAAIARRWAQLREIGFTEERGFTCETSRKYVEFVEWLTRLEVQQFYSGLADKLSADEAAHIAEEAIGLINETLGLMHTRAILKELDALYAADAKDKH